MDAEAGKGNPPSGLVPAYRSLRRPGALAALDESGACGALRGIVAHRADCRSSDRRDDGHRHGAQSVHGAAELQGARRPSIEEQRRRLRDPELRRKILAEKPSDVEVAKLAQFRQLVTSRWDKFFTMGDPPDYEPGPEKSIAAIAAGTGRTPDEVAYDYIIEENQYLYFPVVNYVTGDHEPILEMLNDPACLLGLSDGGAHCTSIVDSGLPSFMLAHWGRDRRRGPLLPLEHLVKRQTSDTADFFGMSDRGRLLPGLRADVNIIDFDRLRLHKPELVHDMPAGGRRFVQRADGYEATIAAGIPIFERGVHTGAMPGRLLRAGHNGHR
ncbi:MAG TPA: amidohydrolase family protein [Bradyrhizobium sp.]